MDPTTVVGMVMAIGSLLMAHTMEGGQINSLINIPAALIVLGGTVGATIVSTPLKYLMVTPRVALKTIFGKLAAPQEISDLLAQLIVKARREGVLGLESELEGVSDSFLQKGIGLVVFGADPEVVRTVLENEVASMNARHSAGSEVFKQMGGYAPTLGVLGTVMGLIHMLAQLNQPGDMGAAIAAAFIATLYGVGWANLVFLPIAAKLKARSTEEAHMRELMIEGILSLQAGDNPMTLQERLKAFMAPKVQEKIGDGRGPGPPAGPARGEPTGGREGAEAA